MADRRPPGSGADLLASLAPPQLRLLARTALDLLPPTRRRSLLQRFVPGASSLVPADPFPEAMTAVDRAACYLSANEGDLAGWLNGAWGHDHVDDELAALTEELDRAFAAVCRHLGPGRPCREDRRRAETLLHELREEFLGWENPLATGVPLGEQLDPPEHAHLLVMCARATATGGVLDGAEAALDELVEFISEELGEGLAPVGDRRALVSICEKTNPGSREWLGL